VTSRRNAATGRFAPRFPVCESCRRIQHENLAGELLCVWERCELYRKVVGHSGADAGSLA
jgi:hypothetical protein